MNTQGILDWISIVRNQVLDVSGGRDFPEFLIMPGLLKSNY
jgi:hypothetical protein